MPCKIRHFGSSPFIPVRTKIYPVCYERHIHGLCSLCIFHLFNSELPLIKVKLPLNGEKLHGAEEMIQLPQCLPYTTAGLIL